MTFGSIWESDTSDNFRQLIFAVQRRQFFEAAVTSLAMDQIARPLAASAAARGRRAATRPCR